MFLLFRAADVNVILQNQFKFINDFKTDKTDKNTDSDSNCFFLFCVFKAAAQTLRQQTVDVLLFNPVTPEALTTFNQVKKLFHLWKFVSCFFKQTTEKN